MSYGSSVTDADQTFAVQRHGVRRVVYGALAVLILVLSASWPWLFSDADSLVTYVFMGFLFTLLAFTMALYAYRMASPLPFAVVSSGGVEVWQWHRRIHVPWEEGMELFLHKGELQLQRFSPGARGLGRIVQAMVPAGGESLKLRDMSCRPSAAQVAAAVRRLCPYPVGGV